MKPETCQLPLPQSPLTSFSFMQKQMKAPCFQTSPILQRVSLTAHVFFTTAMALLAVKDVHCTLLPIISMNHPLTGNHLCVGSCRSKWIGKCAKTTWKLPPFADGPAPTGVITAQKWRGAALRAQMPMLEIRPSLTALVMSYLRLLAPKCSFSFGIALGSQIPRHVTKI